MNKNTKRMAAILVLALAGAALAQEAGTAEAGATNLGEGLTAIGQGLALGLGAVGTGIAQSRIGSALVGAVAEDPGQAGRLLIYFLLPETLVIFGFLALFLI